MSEPKRIRLLSSDDHDNVVFGIEEPYIVRDPDGSTYENYMTSLYTMPKDDVIGLVKEAIKDLMKDYNSYNCDYELKRYTERIFNTCLSREEARSNIMGIASMVYDYKNQGDN